MKELIERLEAAEGPSRELDAEIYALSDDAKRWGRKAYQLPLNKRRSRFDDGWVTGNGNEDKFPEDLKTFTSSIDAALTLEENEEEALTMLWAAISDAWGDLDIKKDSLTIHRVLKAFLARALRARQANGGE